MVFGCLSQSKAIPSHPYTLSHFPTLGNGDSLNARQKNTKYAIKEYDKFIKQDDRPLSKAIGLLNNIIVAARNEGVDDIAQNVQKIIEEILKENDNLAKERHDELERVQTKFDAAFRDWKTNLENVKTSANQQTNKKLWLTGIGIGITVSVAALTAASPANLALVAGLGTAGGGIITFQNALVEEGQTRVANARVHEAIKKRGEDAIKEYYQAYTAMKLDLLGKNYVQYSITAWKSVGELETAAVQEIALSSEEEIEASRKLAESEKAELETSIKGMIESIKTEKSSRKSSLEKYKDLKKALDEALKPN